MKVIYSILTRLLCVLGCFYQTYKLSRIHFSYESTTHVRYESQRETTLPALSLCYYKIFQMRDEFWRKYGGNTTLLWNSLQNLTIEEQFKMMDDRPRRLNRCRLYKSQLNRKKNYVDCGVVSGYKSYLDGLSYCFTVFPQLDGQPDDNYQVFETENKYLFYVALSKLNLSSVNKDRVKDRVTIQMHSRNDVFYDSYRKGTIEFIMNDSDYCLVKFTKTVFRHMFEPIPECFEGLTRDQCLYKCKIKDFVNKTAQYPNVLMADQRNSSLKFFRSIYHNINVSDNECRRSCSLKTECFKEYFTTETRFMSYHSSERTEPNIFQAIVEYPAHPSMVYELNLRMSFEEYLCLLSSIFSLWFGISFVMFTDFCPNIVKKLREYFRKPETIRRKNLYGSNEHGYF